MTSWTLRMDGVWESAEGQTIDASQTAHIAACMQYLFEKSFLGQTLTSEEQAFRDWCIQHPTTALDAFNSRPAPRELH